MGLVVRHSLRRLTVLARFSARHFHAPFAAFRHALTTLRNRNADYRTFFLRIAAHQGALYGQVNKRDIPEQRVMRCGDPV